MIDKARVSRGVPIWLVSAVILLVVGGGLCLAQDGGGGDGAAGVTTEEKKTPKMTFLELLEKGGLQFMIPIGLCSLLGVTIIIERLFALRKGAVLPGNFLPGLKGVFHPDSKDRAAGLGYCGASDSPLSRVISAGIRKMHKGEEAVESAIEDAGALEIDKLRRNMHMLYGLSTVTPMLGLLGTVWGMIEAFQVASIAGLGKAESLATGIYQALVTTFAGLAVAIPILIVYYYFVSKIDQIVHQMNDVTMEFVDHYTGGEELALAGD